MTQAMPEILDIVIAWVDGDDPKLKQKRAQYQQQVTAASDAISSTRFASNNEIYFNIASILKYVPFCRHIYIVSDEQQPKFIKEFAEQGLCSADKIRIVDHKTIFSGYEAALPTFNTRSIETMLWNIPGLSDYFIYLNDDFYFNQTASMTDFFDNGQMVVYGHWRNSLPLTTKLEYRKSLQKLFGKPVQPKHTIAQMLGAKIVGMNKFFEIHHYPHIVDRNILESFLLNHPDLLKNQIKYKFRDVEQFNPISLMNHLKIKKQEVSLMPDIDINYLKNERSIGQFIQGLEDTKIKYGCIQSMDQLDQQAFKQVNEAMKQKLSDYLPQSLLNTPT